MRFFISESRRPTPPSRRAATLMSALVLALPGTGCQGVTEPAAPVTYDVDVELTYMSVLQDCEDAAGNPGEWVWEVVVRVGPRGQMASAGTSSHPSSSGAVSWSDGVKYGLGETLHLTGVTEAQRDSVTIRLTSTEWDFDTNPPTPDPDMNGKSSTDALLFGTPTVTEWLGVGAGRCGIALRYAATWTPR